MKRRLEDEIEMQKDSHKVKYLFAGIIIAFPFCTPQTVQLMRYKDSKRLGRFLGVVLVLIAILAVI